MEAGPYPTEIFDERVADCYGWDLHQQRRLPFWWLNRILIVHGEREKMREQINDPGEVVEFGSGDDEDMPKRTLPRHTIRD